MKRLSSIICLVLLCLAFTSCNIGRTDGVDIKIGESSKFSKQEIQSAINCVIAKFKDFSGCKLTKIWYDEEQADTEVESYMSTGLGSINGVQSENVIVLFSNFDVDSTGADGGLNPDSTYTDWNWVLIRDSKTSGWKVDTCGY